MGKESHGALQKENQGVGKMTAVLSSKKKYGACTHLPARNQSPLTKKKVGKRNGGGETSSAYAVVAHGGAERKEASDRYLAMRGKKRGAKQSACTKGGNCGSCCWHPGKRYPAHSAKEKEGKKGKENVAWATP